MIPETFGLARHELMNYYTTAKGNIFEMVAKGDKVLIERIDIHLAA